MTTTDIYKKIVNIANDYEYNGSPVKITTPEEGLYTDLGLDSLAVVELCMLIEDDFKITFDDEQISKFKTINDIVLHTEKLRELYRS